VPKREIPDNDAKTGEHGPKDEAMVNLGGSVEQLSPRELGIEDATCGLGLLLFEGSRGCWDTRLFSERLIST
jgi:hypothetical protein